MFPAIWCNRLVDACRQQSMSPNRFTHAMTNACMPWLKQPIIARCRFANTEALIDVTELMQTHHG